MMLMLHDFPIVLDVIVDIVFIVEGYFHECFLLLRQAFVLFPDFVIASPKNPHQRV